MIRLEKVNKSYGRDQKAVADLDLLVRPGEIFGFLGPNGAGKTTTIKLITGVLAPDSGTILVNGHDLARSPLAAKASFGYVPDDPNIFLRLRAIEYLSFLADVYQLPPKTRQVRISYLAERLELADVLTGKIQSFSHGMRQKLLLIGALLHQPDLWILDEPMTGLDPRSAFALKDMMREQADRGKTVFFSTHVLDVAEKVCDRVAIIGQGRILFCGTIQDMQNHFRQHSSLEAMFLELVDQAQNTGARP